MIRLNGFLILSLMVSISCCRPEKSALYGEELKLYNDALEQIIGEYFMNHCLLERDADFVEKTNDAFYSGKIDSTKYYRIGDSLFGHRKTQLPKCIMEYSPLFYATLPIATSEMKTSMTEALQGDFFKEHFGDIPMNLVIDTLLQNTTLNWNTISLSYINFVAHDTLDQRHRYGKIGVGVIAFSKPYFDHEADHAILLFEFRSSSNFQRGENVFLEKAWGHWKVVGFRNIWIT